LLASAPTGTGKTLAFVLPAIQYLLDFGRKDPGFARVLVMTPTRELAYQVYDEFKHFTQFTDLNVGVITGGINYGSHKDTLEKNNDILVATPGRLIEYLDEESFQADEIEVLILDEADRMLDMGFVGEMTIGDGSITNASVSPNADIARSKLAQDALKCYTVPMLAMRVWDAQSPTKTYAVPIHAFRFWTDMAVNLPAAAANDDMGIVTGTPGTDVATLQGIDFKGGTSDHKCAFEFNLPSDYEAGQAVTLRLRCAMLTTVSAQTSTVDANCYKSNRSGAAGADIVATAEQSINSLTHADKDFVITPTGLAAGDRLVFVLSFIGTDDTHAGVMIPEISQVEIIYTARIATNLPTAAANDDMGLVIGTPGTDVSTLQGVDFGGTSTDEKCSFEYELPAEYDAGNTITLRIRAAMLTTIADAPTTVDVNCYKSDRDGAASSDLCATAAQSINSLTPANLDFTITPTGLAAGDRLVFVLTFAGSDTGDLDVMIPEISQVELLLDVRG
jgi:hypothetical protein